jgi:hypothetical protein
MPGGLSFLHGVLDLVFGLVIVVVPNFFAVLVQGEVFGGLAFGLEHKIWLDPIDHSDCCQ